MIDFYVDDLKLERIDTVNNGDLSFRLFFRGEKDTTISIVLDTKAFVTLYDKCRMRCETCDLIEIRGEK